MTGSPVLAEETATPDTTSVAAVPDAGTDADSVRPPGATWGVLASGTAAPAAPAEEDEKKRVKKKKIRSKNEGAYDNEYDDDDDDGGDCFGACFGSFLGSLFSSDPEPARAAPPPPPPAVQYQQTQAPSQATPPPLRERVVTPADFSLVLTPSWWIAGPSDIMDEFGNGGGRLGVDAYFLPAENFEVGFGMGFGGAAGKPLYDYETSTRLDSAQHTYLWMFDAGMRLGMIHVLSDNGPFLRWGLGPRLFWVKSTAELEVYELPGMTRLDDRKEALEDWRIGGDLAVSMMWGTNSSMLLGFSTRLFVIPWDSSFTRSLTLDYIGTKSLVGIELGVAVHFNGF